MLTRYELARKEKFDIENGRHRFDSLFITLTGEYEYAVGKVTRRILPYQPVVFKKGTTFQKRIIRPIEYLIISPAVFLYEGEWWLTYDENDRLRLKSSVDHLKNAILQGGSEKVIEHFFNDILLTAKTEATAVCDNSLRRIYEYMTQHFEEELSLAYLAEIYGYSVQTLIVNFKKHYGKTPMKYITDLRISKAKELLLNTTASVAQVAEMCGYENVYYFSNTFKKETGISPLKFRQGYLL